VPSKALLAAAKAAHAVRDGARFGVVAGEPQVDFGPCTATSRR
jgi:pyruvate/2-oxoglutarate dehydrogenase complex dihydrolipoamide dehydrogenase (E3) component